MFANFRHSGQDQLICTTPEFSAFRKSIVPPRYPQISPVVCLLPLSSLPQQHFVLWAQVFIHINWHRGLESQIWRCQPGLFCYCPDLITDFVEDKSPNHVYSFVGMRWTTSMSESAIWTRILLPISVIIAPSRLSELRGISFISNFFFGCIASFPRGCASRLWAPLQDPHFLFWCLSHCYLKLLKIFVCFCFL